MREGEMSSARFPFAQLHSSCVVDDNDDVYLEMLRCVDVCPAEWIGEKKEEEMSSHNE